MAVETTAAEILGLLGSSVVGVHDREGCVGAHEGAGMLHGAGGVGTEVRRLCGHDYG